MKIHKLFYAAFIQLLMVGTAFSSSENPSFENNTLTINAVDTDSQLGKYQDVMFQLTEEGEWKLLDYKVKTLIPKSEDGSYGLNTVEIITTDALPIQAFLKVSPILWCPGIGQMHQKLVGNHFEVSVYYGDAPREDEACVAAMASPKIIALPIYGLLEGEYTYSVNGDFSGSFNLTSSNRLIDLGN
ncbi:MAG: hypothetical protein L3J00_07225 [Thiomicrorhabdus sp.]|nr:hypothetical protein [Thiomicrorhabdus sp.]